MALTPIALTGFEHRTLSTVGGGLFTTSVNLGVNSSIDTAVFRSGSASMRFQPTASAAATAVMPIPAGKRLVTTRMYVYMRDLGTSGTVRRLFGFVNANGEGRVVIDTDNTVAVDIAGAGRVSSGISMVTSNWYRLELAFDTSGATAQAWLRVDGSNAVTTTRAQAAADNTSLSLGTGSTLVYDLNIDDVIYGEFSAAGTPEYWGDGKIVGLWPNADGTHKIDAANTIEDETAADFTNASTTVNTKLNKNPLSGTATRVQQAGDATATESGKSYAEILFGDLPSGVSSVNAVRALLSYGSAGTAANTGSTRIKRNDGGSTAEVLGVGTTGVAVTGGPQQVHTIPGTGTAGTGVFDMSDTGPVYKGALVPKTQNGTGSAFTGWTVAEIDALRARIGFADDISPIPYWYGVMLEVDYVPPAPAFRQQAFRLRNDDGSETTATWKAALNTSVPMAVDEVFRVRFLMQETAGGTTGTDWQLFWDKNGANAYGLPFGAGADVNSGNFSAHVTDFTATTQQLGSGTFDPGFIEAGDGYYANTGLGANEETEMEFVLKIIGSEVALNDVIRLRVKNGVGADFASYVNTPAIKISQFRQAAYRARNDNGSELAATWKAALNTTWEQAPSENFRLRTAIRNETGLAGTYNWQLQYRKNGGAWTDVTASSANVKSVASTHVVDAADTTQRLGNYFNRNASDIEIDTTGFETGTSYYIAAGATISRDTTRAWEGKSSLKVDVTDATHGVRVYPGGNLKAGRTYTVSVYIWAATSRQVRLLLRDETNAADHPTGATITGNGAWQRATLTYTHGPSDGPLNVSIRAEEAATTHSFWIDGLMVEETTKNTLFVNFANAGEAGTTSGWVAGGTNTVASTTEQVFQGTRSIKATYQNTLNLAFQTGATGPPIRPSSRVVASGYVYLPADWDGGAIAIGDEQNTFSKTLVTSVDCPASTTGQWFRIYRVWDAAASGDFSTQITIRTTSAPTAGRFIYVDALQFEVVGATDTAPTDWAAPAAPTTWRRGGTFQANNDGIAETDAFIVGPATIANHEEVEHEFVLQVVDADTVPGDTLEFRTVKGDGEVLEYYDQTPSLTVRGTTGINKLRLGTLTDPAISTGHILRVRARSTQGGGDFTYALYEGTTKRAEATSTLTNAFQTFVRTLSAAEADSITSYAALDVWMSAAKAGPLNVEVSWIELEVPIATTPTITAAGAITPTGTNIKRTSKTLTASLTPSGVKIKQVQHRVVGSVTPSSTLTPRLQVNRTLAGVLNLSGAVIKQLRKSMSGAVIPTGAALKRIIRSYVGFITPTGALLKQLRKTFVGAITPTSALSPRFQANRFFAGAVTPTGTALKRMLKTLTGAVTPTGVVLRRILKSVTGTITPTGTLIKSLQRVFSGAITPTSLLEAIRVSTVITRSFAGAITPTATLVKRVGKIVVGSVTPTGSVARFLSKVFAGVVTPTSSLTLFKTGILQLLGSVAPIGTLAKRISKTYAGSSAPTGAVFKSIWRRLVGAITPTSTLTSIKALLRAYAGAITPTSTLTRRPYKALIGGATPVGTIIKTLQRRFVGSITPTSVLSATRRMLKSLAGAITPTGAVEAVRGAVTFFRSMSGLITPAGALVRSTFKRVAGNVSLIGSVVKSTGKSFVGAVVPTGAATTTRTVVLALAGAITATGSLTRSAILRLFGNVTPIGTITKHLTQTLVGSITPTGVSIITRKLFISVAGAILGTGEVLTTRIINFIAKPWSAVVSSTLRSSAATTDELRSKASTTDAKRGEADVSESL